MRKEGGRVRKNRGTGRKRVREQMRGSARESGIEKEIGREKG